MNKLKYVSGRVIVKIDLDSKESHRFADGTEIAIRKKYDNMNRRETESVNAVVVSAENIREGSEILVHHNAAHEVHQIFDYIPLSGKETADRVKYYSLPESECFLYREGASWLPLPGFATGLRVFSPYTGIIEGIAPNRIGDVLYVTSGHLKGKVVYTLKNCDYEIIFQDTTGRENRIIRFRHFEDPDYDDKEKREEVIGIAELFTGKVDAGEYLVGYGPSDAKTVQEWQKLHGL